MTSPQLTNDFIKDLYDTEVPNKYQQYEFDRWFADSASWVDYVMTHRSIRHHLKDITFSRVLELGPGPGTWTRLLFRHNPLATFDLVDISEAMKCEFDLEMRGGHDGVRYIVSDFISSKLDGGYDFFFSSRAIEYFSDKRSLVHKLSEQLVSGATGVVITKNRGFSRDNRPQHSGQMKPQEFKELLQEGGFSVLGIFPCVIRIPLLGRLSIRIPLRIFKRFYTRPFGWVMSFFVESFCVVFVKK